MVKEYTQQNVAYSDESAEELFRNAWNAIMSDVAQVLKTESLIREDNARLIRNYFALSSVEARIIDLNENELWMARFNGGADAEFTLFIRDKLKHRFLNYIGSEIRPNV